MFDRIIRNITPNTKNDTTDNSGKSTLDELAKQYEVIEKDKMSHIEGGHTDNHQINKDRVDITSVPGSRTPS